MGEVVLSSDECMELDVLQEAKSTGREVDMEKMEDGSGGGGGLVRWERFLPRMALRVLLVEADDSTRQIIAALLRKCSYRVSAVPDGLKAWEVLRGRPHNIDLILTEVELPSISGFALLTLVMEHEICKNIPVIMMSSHDSISMVYKCMLRGAADFLVKPVRRNELKNLWQHVWRRQSQSSSGGNGPQDESVAEQKVEATAENNAGSNHSSGYKACIQRNKECIEKGSDAQSSCTKPDMEAESAYMENMQDPSQTKWRSLASDTELQRHDTDVELDQKLLMQENKAGGSAMALHKDANTVSWSKEAEQESQKEDPNNTSEACDNNDVLLNSSKEAIDLIGAFDNYSKCSYRNPGSNTVTSNFDSPPQLDLSLRRCHPLGSENQIANEKHTLNHSNASAFSRYINRTMPPVRPALAGVCNQQKECATDSDKHLPTCLPANNSDPPGPSPTLLSQRTINAMATSQSGQAETAIPCPQQRVFPVPVPVRGIKIDNICAGYGSAIFCAQSGPSPLHSPTSASQQDGSIQVNRFHQSSFETSSSKQLFEPFGQNATTNLNHQIRHNQEHKLESLDDRGHFSPATDQSGSSSLCNGTASHLNSIGCGSICGSNGTVNPVSVGTTSHLNSIGCGSICGSNGAEGGNEEGLFARDGNLHRSIQREAALTKFRLKRKDRCFEKKVRYESRKKLAEQRPRVKGQFVRQVPTDPRPVENNNFCGNSLDG
ncbi:two-component response regulator-like APRR9 [Malania oleifera]|uniref:two-component response regulator-like APRR9 n=1 Tax=Malania oleifera TaxID=397392 RepID=UPI0025AD9D5C|nr:two-component response regulator-like APRR9 [Malania oleifera]